MFICAARWVGCSQKERSLWPQYVKLNGQRKSTGGKFSSSSAGLQPEPEEEQQGRITGTIWAASLVFFLLLFPALSKVSPSGSDNKVTLQGQCLIKLTWLEIRFSFTPSMFIKCKPLLQVFCGDSGKKDCSVSLFSQFVCEQFFRFVKMHFPRMSAFLFTYKWLCLHFLHP